MPDFNGFEQNENRIKDVGSIENCVLTLLTARAMKDRTLLFHIVYTLILSFVGYFSMDSALFGTAGILGIAAFFAFPAFYTYTVLYSPMYLKALGVFTPVAAYAVRFAVYRLEGETAVTFVTTLLGFLMCVAISAIFSITVTGKKTKLWCLVAVTVCIVVFFLSVAMFSAAKSGAGVGLYGISKQFDDTSKALSQRMGDILEKELEDEQMYSMYTQTLPELSEKTPEEIGNIFEESMIFVLGQIKNMLPAIFALVCMFYGFIFVALFSLASKILHIPLFICIMDRRWCYRIPASCITFFDVVLLFVIIDNFFGLPANIGMAVFNLLLILLPVVTVSTLKAIHFFIYRKLHSASVSYVLCAIIAVVSFMFLGVWGYLLLCSLGVSFVAQRYRLECEAAKYKIKKDIDMMLILCGCKELPVAAVQDVDNGSHCSEEQKVDEQHTQDENN